MGLKTAFHRTIRALTRKSWENFLMRGGSSSEYDDWLGEPASYSSDFDRIRAMERAGWIYDCVTCIADNFNRPRWWFEKVSGKKKQEETEIPELAQLLRRPTPWFGGSELFEATISYLLLCGKAYWYLGEIDALSLHETTTTNNGMVVNLAANGEPILKYPDRPLRAGRPKEIWYLRPDCVKPVMGGPGELFKEFIYEPSPGRKQVIPADAVVYFRRFDPLYMTEGLGVVEAIRVALDSNVQAEKYNQRFFKNSARPDLALVTDQDLKPEQAAAAAAEWERRYGGVNNSGKPAVLGSGAKPFLLSASAKDMDFLNLRKFSREDIFSAFRVPLSKVGIAQASPLGNSSAQQDDRTFWADCMEPHMRRFCDKVSAELVSRWDPEAQMVMEDMTPADLQMQSQIAVAMVGSGIWNINEARTNLGLGEELEGEMGNKHFVPSSWVPLDKAGQVSPTSPFDYPYRPAPKPTEEESGQDEGQAEETAPEEAAAEETPAKRRRLAPGMLHNGKRYQKSLSESDKALTYRKFKTTTIKEFQKQERAIVKGAATALAPYAEKFLPGKAVVPDDEEMGGIIDNLGDWEELQREFRKAIRMEFVHALEYAGVIALRDLGVDVTFDIEHPAVLRWLADYIPILEDSVTSTTKGALSVAIRTAIDNNATLGELQDAVREVFKQAKNVRAEVIAITESGRALNQGELQAWRQSGVVVAKQWVLGPNPCDACLDMADRVMEINTDFYVTGDTTTNQEGDTIEIDYVDIDTPPLHSNCVCWLVPVLEEAA